MIVAGRVHHAAGHDRRGRDPARSGPDPKLVSVGQRERVQAIAGPDEQPLAVGRGRAEGFARRPHVRPPGQRSVGHLQRQHCASAEHGKDLFPDHDGGPGQPGVGTIFGCKVPARRAVQPHR